jgi:hypothetical protein
VTVDGSLADWLAIATPMYLNAANAAYLQPAATPSAADLSAAFWLSCSEDDLVIAGVITDTTIISSTTNLVTDGDLTAEQIEKVRSGMKRVVMEAGGTASRRNRAGRTRSDRAATASATLKAECAGPHGGCG